MSSDDHGHGGHGDGHGDGPSDIIPVGSWQDNLLAMLAIAALAGLTYFSAGYVQGIKVPEAHHGAAHAEHGSVSGGHAVGNGAVPSHGDAEAPAGGDEFHNGSQTPEHAAESSSSHEPESATAAEQKPTIQPEANPNVEGSKAADPPSAGHSDEGAAKDSTHETKGEAPSH
jgi:hypothetical protein